MNKNYIIWGFDNIKSRVPRIINNKEKEKIKIEYSVGQKLGKLTIVGRDYRKNRTTYYICNCSCGTKGISFTEKTLEHKKSCGCLKKKRGFNEYKIDGDTTIIYFTNRYDEIINEGYIDTEELSRLIELDFHWGIVKVKNTEDEYYVKYVEYCTGENGEKHKKSHYLHRTIMNVTDPDIPVDHRELENHGSLDNRKSNLRVATFIKNSTSRKSKNSNNKSGHRNVSWNGNTWSVQLQIEGVNTTLKRFKKNKLEEAGEYAEKMREKYYGKEYAGKS